MNEKPTLLPAAHRPHAGVGCASPARAGGCAQPPFTARRRGNGGVAPPPPNNRGGDGAGPPASLLFGGLLLDVPKYACVVAASRASHLAHRRRDAHSVRPSATLHGTR